MPIGHISGNLKVYKTECIYIENGYVPYIWMVFRQYEFYSDSLVCSVDEIVSRRRRIGTVFRRLQSLWLHDL